VNFFVRIVRTVQARWSQQTSGYKVKMGAGNEARIGVVYYGLLGVMPRVPSPLISSCSNPRCSLRMPAAEVRTMKSRQDAMDR
jgi:hypothetical protein